MDNKQQLQMNPTEYGNQPPQYYPQGGQQPQYYPPGGQQPQYYPPGPQQPGPQTNVVVVNQPKSYTSFTGPIILSCCVFWCCGWIFGLIAFIIAMVGQSSAASGNEPQAQQMLKASYGVSIAGIVVGVIILIIIIVVVVTGAAVVATQAARCQNPDNCQFGYYFNDQLCKICCTYGDSLKRDCLL